jgi:hypothetical protein
VARYVARWRQASQVLRPVFPPDANRLGHSSIATIELTSVVSVVNGSKYVKIDFASAVSRGDGSSNVDRWAIFSIRGPKISCFGVNQQLPCGKPV